MKIPSRLVWVLVLILTGAFLTPPGRGQTTVLSESFSNVLTPGWTMGDSNAAAPALWWGSVSDLYGSVASRSRGGKGYCAALGVSGFVNNSESYSNNLASTMSRTINLAPYSYANLRFWGRVPSLGAGDSWRSYIDNTILVSSAVTTTNWVERRLNLNAYTGGSHLLRFVFISDASGVAEGLYLDDIEVTGANVPLTETPSSLFLANNSGYVIDSDAANTNIFFNRETIQATSYFLLENFSGNSTNLPYVYTFRLRDTNGALFPIYNAGGVTTNAGYTHVITNAAQLTIAQETNLVTTGFLKPAARLNHRTAYRVELSVTRPNGALVFNATNGPYHFYHFTNMVSGDAALNAIAELQSSGWERTWLLNTASGSNTFLVTNEVVLHRYDNFQAALPSLDVLPLKLDVELRNATTDALVPLAFASSNYTPVVTSYTAGSADPIDPRVVTNQLVFAVRPAAQLDSVNATYRLITRLSHTNQTGQAGIAAQSITNAAQRLLAYNGRLICGDINTTMHAFNADPVPGAVTPGSNVATTVSLAVDGATVDGVNGPTFGNGAALGAKLLVNGDAILTSGFQTVNNATEGSQGNVSFSRGLLVLNANGGVTADITFHLPTGFGYHTNNYQARGLKKLLSDLRFATVGLNQNLAPKSNLTLYPPGGEIIQAVEETKSIYIAATQMVWNATSARFELLYNPSYAETLHVRALDYELLRLVSSNLFQTNMAVKRSNDRYMNHTLSFTGPSVITADAGGNAQLNGTVAFTASGGFQTHFPYDTGIQWSGGSGFMVISNDAVVTGSGSYLSGVGNLSVPYVGDCDGCSSTPTTNRVGITPHNNRLSFTRDGGLVAPNQGPILYTGLSGKVAWGYIPGDNDYAQAVLGPTNMSFAMPGAFLRGADNTSNDDDGAGVILLTGAGASNPGYVERPGAAAYAVGSADYAGLNVRALSDGLFNARSIIAGSPVNYDWRGNSKLYLRLAGVSGVHSAVGGTFPANLTLWGYNFGFSNYSLAFLDNENVASRTDGYINLPNPSEITVEFQELKFTCSGKPESAELPASAHEKYLTYWNADIELHALNFVSNIGAECDVDDGFLTLGVTGYATPVNSPLQGVLGFFPNGTLISKSDGIAELDSRLKLPSSFELKGAKDVPYRVTTVGDAYYNRFNAGLAPGGFITFAGQMDVPFFEDVRVHLHTSAKKAAESDPPVYLMGGWTADDSPGDSQGWLINDESYFNAAYFDPQNAGWPTSVALDNYRENYDSEKYHPRAQKLWLDIVDLDYPLKWSPASRNFRSFEGITTELIILSVNHQVRGLDAKAASLDFGASYGKINTSDFFLDLMEDAGTFATISNAIGGSAFASMLDSMLSLNLLLEATGGQLIEAALDPYLDPVMEQTYQGLKTRYNALANKANFPAAADAYLTTNFLGSISNDLFRFTVGTTNVGVVVSNINFFTDSAYKGSREATNALGKISNIVEEALTFLGKAWPDASNSAAPVLRDLAKSVEPTILDINAGMHEVGIVLTNALAVLKEGGEWNNEIRQAGLDGKVILGQTATQARTDIKAYLNTFNYNVDNPFTQVDKQQFKDRLRREVREAFMASSVWEKIQKGLKYRLYDANSSYRSGIDGYFDGINGLVRSAAGAALSGVDDTLNSALGEVGKYLGAAKITGSAEINEDSLRRLRLDGEFHFKMPDEMVFKAFLEILEIDSENRVEGCFPAGGKATEVTLGALDVPMKWTGSEIKVDVTGKFVLEEDGALSGLGGSILADGKIKLGTVEIKQFGLNLMFGKYENYGAALCRVRVNNSVEVGGGLFAGIACTYDPIKWTLAGVSPKIVDVINPEENFGPLPVAGGLFFADGEFPIWSYSCLLEIRVIAGGGAWYFNEGKNYGMLLRVGVAGTVVCVLSAKGVATLVGSPGKEGFTLIGTIAGEGCFGPCPLCICGDFEEGVMYIEGKGWEELPDKEDK